MAAEICPTTGQPCDAREVCIRNRQVHAGVLERTAKIEDSPLGRVVGLVARFKDLSGMPHFVQKGKAEQAIRATDAVLERDCPGEEKCAARQAFAQNELEVYPLAQY